uniref:Uncharacterized protein n=1 Tax=Myoviridae sp. ctCo31 TaxID=2825053 RepID=A0A8S5UMG5_9CAUD|nr:MAG TPA: hypothetical protein [Myoviridae sp. ctCo31]
MLIMVKMVEHVGLFVSMNLLIFQMLRYDTK